jgi:hypothetical protein
MISRGKPAGNGPWKRQLLWALGFDAKNKFGASGPVLLTWTGRGEAIDIALFKVYNTYELSISLGGEPRFFEYEINREEE